MNASIKFNVITKLRIAIYENECGDINHLLCVIFENNQTKFILSNRKCKTLQ